MVCTYTDVGKFTIASIESSSYSTSSTTVVVTATVTVPAGLPTTAATAI